MNVQSSLRRRAALIRADRAAGGKDAANWEGGGGMCGRSVSRMTEHVAACCWSLSVETVKCSCF